jgi:hypothetical protein
MKATRHLLEQSVQQENRRSGSPLSGKLGNPLVQFLINL